MQVRYTLNWRREWIQIQSISDNLSNSSNCWLFYKFPEYSISIIPE